MASIKWLAKYLKGHKFLLIGMLLVTLVLAVLNIANAWCLQMIVSIGAREIEMSLLLAAGITLAVVVSSGVLNVILEYLRKSVVLHISKNMKEELLTELQSMPLQQYEAFHSGDLLTRLSDDVSICASIIPVLVVTLIAGLLSCIAGIIYALYLSWKLTLIVLLLTPLAALWARKFMPIIENHTKHVRAADSQVRAFSQEMLGNPITMRVFKLKDYVLGKFGRLYNDYAQSSLKQSVLLSVIGAGGGVLGFMSFAASVCVGSALALRGEMTIGAVVGFLQLLNCIVWPFSELMQQIGGIKTSLVPVDRVRELETTSKTVSETESTVDTPAPSIKELRIENLCFAYPASKDTLHDLSFTVPAPGILRVCGESGSGKTTLLKLSMGLYTPSSGTIKVIT